MTIKASESLKGLEVGVKKKLLGLFAKSESNAVLAVGSMAALATGAKIPALTMFSRAMAGLEREWRERHPEFQGGPRARLAEAIRFYEETHQDDINRILHVIGIPMIAGGTLGLLVGQPVGPLAPVWWTSMGAFTAGWALNFVGHAFFEKKPPAFAEDPLAFVAGPIWDLKNLGKLVRLARGAQVPATAAA